MRIGFTGTQRGMTVAQQTVVRRLSRSLVVDEAHHGDCVGADADFDAIMRERGVPRHVHPPDDPKKRAFVRDFAVRYPTKPYLERNRAIVDDTDALIAAPKGATEEQRSGTWATIRYARNAGKAVTIVWPNGSIEQS